MTTVTGVLDSAMASGEATGWQDRVLDFFPSFSPQDVALVEETFETTPETGTS